MGENCVQEESMSKVNLTMSISVDGYVAGPDQDEESPLGRGGMALHQWHLGLPEKPTGERGDEVNRLVTDEILREVGAVIMGRNMFGPIRGDWGDESWNGWWGPEPPYRCDTYVLTHHARESVEMQGATTFHFVTDGIESAMEQARASAGDRDISIAGGASTAQQYLRAGMIDQISLQVIPILMGSGERLFDNLRDYSPKLEIARVLEAPAATHLRYIVR
jgi:dihydrofolate reductase